MSLTRISPGLWRFQSDLSGLHHPCVGYVCLLGEDVVLIDPPGDLTPAVLDAVARKRVVRHILITHLQAEHVAGAAHYEKALVHVPAGDEYLCRGEESYRKGIQPWLEPWEWETRGLYEGNLAGALNERPAGIPLRLGDPLQPGTSILGFEVVSTPGHGKHALTLIREIDGRRIGFCGDLIFEGGRLWNWFDCDWDYGPETGQKTLAESCLKLLDRPPDLLCPAHGNPIDRPDVALKLLRENILEVLSQPEEPPPTALNFPEGAEPAEGWRRLSRHLFQTKLGNTVILTSSTGNALVIDDGLCIWEPLPARVAKHDAFFGQIKKTLGIKKIEWLVPTHYHGDHTELIPRLAEREGAGIICLDSIADTMEFPERFNLACPLPWYGSVAERLRVDRRVPEGYSLRWHEYDLRFFHLGGQTWYHQGVEGIVDQSRVMFVGDAFWGTSHSACPVLCWNDAEPVERGWIYALKRMIERKPELLVCGHGSALRDPLPYLQASLAAWDKRLADFDRLNPRLNRGEFFSPFANDHG